MTRSPNWKLKCAVFGPRKKLAGHKLKPIEWPLNIRSGSSRKSGDNRKKRSPVVVQNRSDSGSRLKRASERMKKSVARLRTRKSRGSSRIWSECVLWKPHAGPRLTKKCEWQGRRTKLNFQSCARPKRSKPAVAPNKSGDISRQRRENARRKKSFGDGPKCDSAQSRRKSEGSARASKLVSARRTKLNDLSMRLNDGGRTRTRVERLKSRRVFGPKKSHVCVL